MNMFLVYLHLWKFQEKYDLIAFVIIPQALKMSIDLLLKTISTITAFSASSQLITVHYIGLSQSTSMLQKIGVKMYPL